MREILAAMVLMTASTAALAQERPSAPVETRSLPDPDCSDDRGSNRCGRAAHERMRALYGIESPEALLARGVTMRRAMFVDGYGRDMVAVTFWREPGKVPMVEVRSPRAEGGEEPQQLRAAVSGQTWEEIVSASEFFDRDLAAEPPQPGSAATSPPGPRLCLHSWVVVVEAVDAPRVVPNIVFGTGSVAQARDPSLPVEVSTTPASIRSDTEDACSDGLGMNYAMALATAGLDQLTECSSLKLDDFRNEPHLLATCHRLRGDRLVAGEANAIPRRLERALSTENAREAGWLFVGMGAERQNRYRTAIAGGDVYFTAPVGIDADHAMIRGEIVWSAQDGSPSERADLTLNLLRVTGDFVIDTFELSERRPHRPR